MPHEQCSSHEAKQPALISQHNLAQLVRLCKLPSCQRTQEHIWCAAARHCSCMVGAEDNPDHSFTTWLGQAVMLLAPSQEAANTAAADTCMCTCAHVHMCICTCMCAGSSVTGCMRAAAFSGYGPRSCSSYCVVWHKLSSGCSMRCWLLQAANLRSSASYLTDR
jgi:hypothetical protein